MSGLTPSCKQCNKIIGTTEATFTCLSCSHQFHWTRNCTGFSQTLLDEVFEVRENFFLLCNQCCGLGKRDVVLSTISRSTTAIEIAEKTSNQVKSILSENCVNTSETLEKYSNALKNGLIEEVSSTFKATPRKEDPKPNMEHERQSKHRRQVKIEGIVEPKSNSVWESDAKVVKQIMNHLETTVTIEDLQRIGRKEGRERPRPILVTLNSAFDARCLTSKAPALKTFSSENVYLSRALSPEESELKRKILFHRRSLINSGIEKNRIKIKGLTLSQDGNDIDCSQVQLPPRAPVPTKRQSRGHPPKD